MTLRDEKVQTIIKYWRSRTFFQKLAMWIFCPFCAMEFDALDKADRKAFKELKTRVFNKEA